jgi:CubicO group peptidase (beta-lactamase class C family)
MRLFVQNRMGSQLIGGSMQRHSKRIASTILLGVLCATVIFGQSSRGDVRTAQKPPDLERYISDLHKAFYPEPVAPGIVVVVVKDSRVILLKSFGYADLEAKRPVTPQTVFYIASSAKPFFALTTALLDHKGMIDLNAPLSRYLPDVKLQPPLSPDTIKLRSLLTHTHGIAEGPVNFRMSFSGQGTSSELRELLGTHAASKTRNEFAYSNLGYQVASLALESALKDSWKEIVERTVFRPLGMTNTTTFMSRVKADRLATPYVTGAGDYTRLYNAKADANMHAAGGIVTTGEDLAKWLEVNINRGRVGGKQVFPATVVANTHRWQVDQDNQFAWVRRYGYGLGWNIGSYEGETLVHHHGGFSAFYAHISFMPRQRLGVAVLANEVVFGDVLAEHVAQYLYDTLLGLPGTKLRWERRLAAVPQNAQKERERIVAERARRASRQVPLPHRLEEYAGVYQSPEGGRMEWRVTDGQLAVSFGALWSKAEVFDAAKNELRVELQPGRGQVIPFDFSGDRVQGLTLAGMKFKKIR